MGVVQWVGKLKDRFSSNTDSLTKCSGAEVGLVNVQNILNNTVFVTIFYPGKSQSHFNNSIHLFRSHITQNLNAVLTCDVKERNVFNR